ncbi:MAG: zinc ABC transporter substrate-binding protein [Actinobacteria bacterium]|nr:zinc ABC transporter substrate-binding protein [Actinomycetota bacterium]
MSKKLKTLIYLILIIFIIISLVVFFVLRNQSNNAGGLTSENKKIQIVTTLFPLYDFAKNIGQDKVEVSLLLPPGVDAHTFEPRPSDVILINQADVFIYTGKFMEPWADDIVKSVTNKNLIVVNASNGVTLIPAAPNDSNKQKSQMDPHIWLDFDNAGIIVNSIAKALSEKDPVNSHIYEKNTRDYLQQLKDLDDEYKLDLSKCSSKEIIYAGHYAFGYLAKRYGLKYLAAQGVSPDSEPTAVDLINLVNQIKKDNIKYIFYEELASPKIAQTLSSETGAKLLLLNAGHNITREQLRQGVAFISIMKNNLANLKIGLGYRE